MRAKVIIVALTCLFILGAGTFSIVGAQSSEGLAAISDARNRIVTCFKAAQLAESVSANISSLTMTLNDATKLLSDAEVAFSRGDFLGARSLAIESQNLLSNFESEADSLRIAAIQAENLDFWINIVGSTVGTVAVIIAGIFLWKFFIKKYDYSEGAKS